MMLCHIIFLPTNEIQWYHQLYQKSIDTYSQDFDTCFSSKLQQLPKHAYSISIKPFPVMRIFIGYLQQKTILNLAFLSQPLIFLYLLTLLATNCSKKNQFSSLAIQIISCLNNCATGKIADMLPNTESEELVKTFTEKITNDKRKITKKKKRKCRSKQNKSSIKKNKLCTILQY